MSRDPSRTSLIRRKFENAMKRKVQSVIKSINEYLVEKDVYGLKEKAPFTFRQPLDREFSFLTDSEKVKNFREFLAEKVNEEILIPVGKNNEPWMNEYIESAYRKGIDRGYSQVNKKKISRKSEDFLNGSKHEFLRATLSTPETISKLQLIYTRAYSDLEGFTAQMSQQTSRILTEGLANGMNPEAIARRMRKDIKSLTKKRALNIARTEVIHAHSEGQLDSFERLGIQKLGLEAEISTAGDSRVCPHCHELSKKTFTIKEARGLLPVHPGCRCCWSPVIEE